MFESHQKSIGTQYTTTVALLIPALVFSPAVFFVSRPFGYVSVTLALVCSALCLGMARASWKHSALTIPSIEDRYSRAN